MFENIKPLKLDSSKQGIWFTSDLHFFHRNIIKCCNRPYNTIEEMNEALINNWNSVVKDDDIIFNLGDFAFASKSKWKEIIEQLKGKHYLILGNHEVSRYPGPKIMNLFYSVEYQMLINIDDKFVHLNHYPFLCYGGTYKDDTKKVYNLHGHVHLLKKDNKGLDFNRMFYTFPYQYDVGVDFNNYKPISWEEVNNKITFQIKNNTNQMCWINSNL